MSLRELYEKHKNFIQERWLPISVELRLQEGPEKKISFLKEEQRRAAKEIQNIEAKSAFMEFLEIEILNLQNKLNKIGSTKAQMSAQSIQTLNTGESKSLTTGEPVEKIDWEAGLAELTFILFRISRYLYFIRWNHLDFKIFWNYKISQWSNLHRIKNSSSPVSNSH